VNDEPHVPEEPDPGPRDIPPETPEQAAQTGTIAARLSVKQRAGGIAVPVLTALVAFLIGGIVVLATGHNPLLAYRDIFNGAGLNWVFHPTTSTVGTAPYNLSQTLLQTTTLILTGLAVAFAFRCGMFNIGGQGQYLIGLIVANWVGSSLAGMSTLPHILLAVVAATAAGAVWAGIAGYLKATVGAHEVITTIMLNWIAIWVGEYLFGDGGPLQNSANNALPISNDVTNSAKLPVFWGVQNLQGLHIGFFVAIGALILFWVILNRTTLGYEVRAVGYNPEAAAYAGISVRKNLIRAMAISGAFAGLAGALDMLGYLYRFGVSDIPASTVGFLGIAVALLGRNTAVGVGLAALLFGALLFGTTHGLQSNVIAPDLAGNLTYMIQGLIVLFVGADILILYLWNARKKLRRGEAQPEATLT
jgi:general nucleoside transport system permease protein